MKTFGSMEQVFSCKWEQIGYAHLHNKINTPKAIYSARLTADYKLNTVTTISTLHNNCYINLTPDKAPYPDTHGTYVLAVIITYEEPSKPPESTKSQIEPSSSNILCVHHTITNIGNNDQITVLTTIINKLQIP